MGMIETWMGVLTKPKETFANEKKNSSIMAGVKQYAIIFAIIGVLMGIAVFILQNMGIVDFSGLPLGGIAAIIVVPILVIVGGIVLTYIGVGIQFIIAKLLGGNGTFEQQYYLISITAIPMLLLSIVVNVIAGILGIIPFLGAIIAFLAILATNLYALYLQTMAIKEAHQFSTLKAVATWFIPAIIYVLVVVAVVAALLVSIMGIRSMNS